MSSAIPGTVHCTEERQNGSRHPHPVFKYGTPVADVLRPFEQFTVSWDTRLRNPRW